MKTTLGILTFAVILASSTSLYALVCYPLTLDLSDPNEVFMVNSSDSPVNFDGLTISSVDGLLDPDAYYGISDRMADGQYAWVLDNFGVYGTGFGKANPSNFQISELLIWDYAVMQPGFRFSLGNCIPNRATEITFGFSSDVQTYTCPIATPGVDDTAALTIVPEPAAMSLLALGALALRRRRR